MLFVGKTEITHAGMLFTINLRVFILLSRPIFKSVNARYLLIYELWLRISFSPMYLYFFCYYYLQIFYCIYYFMFTISLTINYD